MQRFDVVVIVAGQAGEAAATRLADAGLEVAVVEEELVGGECPFWACMPSKGLLRPYEALVEARRTPGAAEAMTRPLDANAVLRDRDAVINELDDSAQLPLLQEHGVTLVRGRGRLAGERQVDVDGELLEARIAVVLAVGSRAAFPPIEGLDQIKDAWTNREATTARRIPTRLLIVGGGPVGVEMAQAYQTLGSQVTLVEGARRLLPRQEDFACAQVTQALIDLGVEIRTGQKAEKLAQSDGTVTVTTSDGAIAEGDELLVALGRRAPTDDLGFETVGLTPGTAVEVDEQMRVPECPWLYAVGDVNGRAEYTHMGKYPGRIAADHILGRDHAARHGADGELAPRVIFTEPQVAAVGHTTQTAARAGVAFDVFDTQTGDSPGGMFMGRGAPGTTRFLVDSERRVLIGCTITGADVADFLHAATIAVVGEVPLDRLRHAVPPFPTRSEIWLSLLEQAGV